MDLSDVEEKKKKLEDCSNMYAPVENGSRRFPSSIELLFVTHEKRWLSQEVMKRQILFLNLGTLIRHMAFSPSHNNEVSGGALYYVRSQIVFYD